MNSKIYGFRKGMLALFALMGIAYSATAQVGVGIATPDASAQLQIESTNKGILIPRVTNTSVITAPANGLMVYQTGGTPGFYYNSGTAISPEWVKLATGSTGLADSAVTNIKVAPNAAISYTKLALTNSIQNMDIVANAITTSKVANGTVTTSKMADSAVSSLKILTNAVNNYHIGNGVLNPAKINASGASTGNVLTYNGSSVVWSAPAGGESSTDAFSALNTTSAVIAIVLGGTTVPLPDYQDMGTFTVDGTDGVFTVPTAGKYRIDYHVSLTQALLVSTRILQNGAPIAASVISPVVAKDEFHTSFLVNLAAGDTLNLQMFGLLGAATLSGGASTGMTVQKL